MITFTKAELAVIVFGLIAGSFVFVCANATEADLSAYRCAGGLCARVDIAKELGQTDTHIAIPR